MGSRSNTPTCKQIAVAQSVLLLTLPNVAHSAEATCWGCGYQSKTFVPERAHLTAVAHGGSSDPGNFVLLCRVCHKAHPDGASREAQLAWLRRREHHDVTSTRALAPVVDALRELAGDDTRLINEWYGEIGDDGVRSVMERGYDAAAASGSEAAVANARWALVGAFEAWLRARRGS